MISAEKEPHAPLGADLAAQQAKRLDAAFRRGYAWSVINAGKLTTEVLDHYLALFRFHGVASGSGDCAACARHLLQALSTGTELLLGVDSATEEEIVLYFLGIACASQADGLFDEVSAERL